jgi:hypothetical protein
MVEALNADLDELWILQPLANISVVLSGKLSHQEKTPPVDVDDVVTFKDIRWCKTKFEEIVHAIPYIIKRKDRLLVSSLFQDQSTTSGSSTLNWCRSIPQSDYNGWCFDGKWK